MTIHTVLKKSGIVLLFLFFYSLNPTFAQNILIDYNFQNTALPAGVSHNGSHSTGKTGGAIASKGAVELEGGRYIQVDISSCEKFTVVMKSSGSSNRSLQIKYKKQGEASYTLLSPVLTAVEKLFDLTDEYPILKTSTPISIIIESVSGKAQIHDLYVEGSSALSSDTEITSFKLDGQIGAEEINYGAGTIKIDVAMGTNLFNIAPRSIGVSAGAGISPAPEILQDFTSGPVLYTVTAQDGTTKNWTVTVTAKASSEKEVLAFKLSNLQIGTAAINSEAGTITVTVPNTADISSLAPVLFTFSEQASVSPSITAVQNFTAPFVYTITAQDNSVKQWTVLVNTIDPDASFTVYQAENADFTGKTDNQHANYTGTGFVDFLSSGENHIVFTVCQQTAGNQTVKFRYSIAKDENRQGRLFVNDIFVQNVDFPRTALFSEWKEAIASVSLDAGVNKIKLTWDETDGPNLDRMDISGAQCASYTLNVNSTNGGTISISPERAMGSYFEGETVLVLAESKPNLAFESWSGDLSGTANPAAITMNADKNITANFKTISTYKINVTTAGIGSVTLLPAGGEYTAGTVVTVTASTIGGSVFNGWSGDLSGASATQSITVDGHKNITASFTDNLNIDFNKVVGFASVSADGFIGPTTGGAAEIPSTQKDTVYINGPGEFGILCDILYKRIKYKSYSNNPLTIVLEPGIYTGAGGTTSVWGNHMLTIQEQANLTIIGRKNVVLNFGINIKRSHNIIIRNLTFQDYYDDGINIGEKETHHIWIDHCTVGHPTTMPTDSEHPDGGIDVKAGASYVTISWTVYRNSWKTGLIGHSDNNGSVDAGRLKVTHFANHYLNTNSRNPRVRFGEVHVLNCLGEGIKLYGIAASNNSQVFAENNFYLNSRWPMYADRTSADFKAVFGNNSDDVFTSKTGNKPAFGLRQIGNEYDDSGLPVITAQINPAMLNPGGRSVKFDELNPETVFDPAAYYSYTPYPAALMRVLVPMYSGADKVDWFTEQTLPLKFVKFDAKLTGRLQKQVELTWTTANEVNTDLFEIQRADESGDFKTIHTIKSQNQPGTNHYNYADLSPLQGTAYYRIKQIDLDKKSQTSTVKIIHNQPTDKFAAYPNPIERTVNLSHPVAERGAVITIYGMNGIKILSKTAETGSRNTEVDLEGLSSGIYLLVFENNTSKHTTKIIKK